MSNLRNAVTTLLEERTGHLLITWLVQQREAGHSLRDIAFDLGSITGLKISHQTIADWLREG